jgi:2-polyprenyl-3-methyl-5-hydroxy-6-metoxy-1,4-benzoquinol methylase
MSYARYSREVRLDDLNNVHTFAVLTTAPGSRVLDLGAADGSVARILARRGCVVTAVERDAGAIDALAGAAEVTVVHADLEGLPDGVLPTAAFDVVLLLDVLEHLVDPATLLGRVHEWLAPGGRVVVSVPNVAHAAVRLAMLQGRFPRSDVGLLDRTHLQFYDETQLRELLRDAGLEVLDLLTVDRDVHETEIDVDTSGLAPEVLAAVTGDASARVYQYFVVAQPVAGTTAAEGGLLQALQLRQRTVEHNYRTLESYATRLDAEMLQLREHLDQCEAHMQHVHEDAQIRAAGELSAVTAAGAAALEAARAAMADVDADRETLRGALRERMRELEEHAEMMAALRRDLDVQRGFADALAGQLPRIAARGGEAHVLRALEGFEAVAPTPAAAAVLASEAAELRRLQQALAIRALGRIDAVLRRMPRVRSGARAMARLVARVVRRA